MNKLTFTIFTLAFFTVSSFAAEFESKGNITFGITPVQSSLDIKKGEQTKEFGGAYAVGDFALSNEKITAAGKIYYRSQATDDPDTAAQKMDIKKAYIRYRPFGDKTLEVSGGKLYSYYLPGNFFQLAEIYTGASRWGKTGFGVKSELNGFTLGLALPVTESYVTYESSFGLNGAVSYDFASINKAVPVKAGASVLYTKTKTTDSKSKVTTRDDDFAETVSVYYTPRLSGFITKVALTASYSYNAEPYVASSTFKNVANYGNSDLKKCQFVSINWRNNFGPVQLMAEGEAGHSIDGDMIPLYAGAQLLIPVAGPLSFKPRVFYYGALDSSNSNNSRRSFEFYPRAWITKGDYIVSCGVDFANRQITKDDYKWEWSVPLYIEYKIGK